MASLHMKHHVVTRGLSFVLAMCCVIFSWAIASPALAYDNPQLLPDTPTNVIDLADSLASVQQDELDKRLNDFEEETGWKLRVLTQYDQTPGRAVKEFWGLDDRSVLLIADPRGGNLLNFSVGDALYELLPRTFWIELQTRYGNQFFVRDNGEDSSIISALESIESCLRRNGCQVVPGLPREQWILTLITSVVGGVICGFAGQPRKPNQPFAWQWVLIFSPLWSILFIAFGIAPVITRTTDLLPLVRNIAGFILGALVAYLTPVLSDASRPESGT